MALCEMIVACQLLAGNWSDLHANGVCLLKDVGGLGRIKRGDVHSFCVRYPLIFVHTESEVSVLT